MVHYAGHSYFDPSTKEGSVFFPGAGRRIDIVRADKFSAWLRSADVRFIFLSSCHSSEAGFVFEMARTQIPAIVGFRWDIEDDKAVEYTKMFYRALFGGDDRCLEHAFLKARKGIYENNQLNPIWAAPVLVIQVPN
jgi:CHAT domain-containing protein